MLVLTGEVLATDHRAGTAAATGRPYSFDTAKVMDREGATIYEVTFGDDFGRPPYEGDTVSIVCSTAPDRNGMKQMRGIRPFGDQAPAAGKRTADATS